MDKAYRQWLKKMEIRENRDLIFSDMEEINRVFDLGFSGKEVFNIFFKPISKKRRNLNLKDRTYVALIISIFHPQGGDLRFAWNSYYGGKEWAIGMECLGKEEIFNPI